MRAHANACAVCKKHGLFTLCDLCSALDAEELKTLRAERDELAAALIEYAEASDLVESDAVPGLHGKEWDRYTIAERSLIELGRRLRAAGRDGGGV